jgi:phosphatidylserine/phosphatidylglycerophosphate/cardiolipin synthase-like enzyme
MNTLAHPLGGAHAKFFVAGNPNYIRAYTGGIDLMPSRTWYAWPDAAISVEGNAAVKMAQFFKQLWNENTSRTPIRFRSEIRNFQNNTVLFPNQQYPSHYGTVLDFDRNAVNATETPDTANKRVQMYRTCPRMNYAKKAPYKRWGALYAAGTGNAAKKAWKALVNAPQLANVPHLWTPSLSYAPKGLFEFKVVVRKAVSSAEKYIFIMDQEAINTQLFKWINIELKKQSKSRLKVIVLTGFDVEDPYYVKSPIMIKAFREYLAEGIDEFSQDEKIFWGFCDTHAKVILIDDTWISVGSANCQKRSFYTDIEMGAVVVHDVWVKDYRKRLWSFLCRPAKNDVPDNIDQALNIWDRGWGNSQNTAQLNPNKTGRAFFFRQGYFPDSPYSSILHQRQDPDSNDSI